MSKGKFRVAVASLIAGFSLLTGFISYRAIASNETDQTWVPLTTVISLDQLTEIIAENTAPSAEIEPIADSALVYEQGDLRLIDFNNSSLCGRGGCALVGYRLSTGERILTIYLERMSSDQPLVEVVAAEGFELPCLLVPPIPEETSIFEETEKETLCYQDNTWSVQ